MKYIIFILAIGYVTYNIVFHFISLRKRKVIKLGIDNKEIVNVNGLIFDFKNKLSRIQLILAVTENIKNMNDLISENSNQNVLALRKVMMKIIGKLPLTTNDETILLSAENAMKTKINEAIIFDFLKIGINIIFAGFILFFIII